MWESSHKAGLEGILRVVLVKKLQESMDMCTGHRDITETLLKAALNTLQSLDQPSKV